LTWPLCGSIRAVAMRQINPWMVSAARYGLRGGHFDPTPGAPPFVSGQARARASGQGCIAGSPQAMLLDHVRCRRLPGGPFGSPAPRGGHTGQIPAGRNALYLSYSPPFEALAQGVRRAPAKALKELNSGDVERLDCVSPLIMRAFDIAMILAVLLLLVLFGFAIWHSGTLPSSLPPNPARSPLAHDPSACRCDEG
jgi:hypothetical protein